MNKRVISAAIVALLIVGTAFWLNSERSTSPNNTSAVNFEAAEDETALPTGLVSIGDQTYVVEIASSAEEQALGLSGRESLGDAGGMLFPFTPPREVSFWMKDMRFPIDIVWIANGLVVGVVKNVPVPAPGSSTQELPTYQPPQIVDYVLELNAGQSQFFNVGDSVTISSLESA